MKYALLVILLSLGACSTCVPAINTISKPISVVIPKTETPQDITLNPTEHFGVTNQWVIYRF